MMGSMVALGDQMVASATNFLTGIIMARSCSQQEFGLYMLCFSLVVFALDLQSSLLSSPFLIYSRQLHGRDRATYLGNSLIQQFILVLLVILLLVAAFLVTGYNLGPKGIHDLLPVLIFAAWPLMLREFIRRVCFAGLEMGLALMVDGLVFVIQIGGLLLLAATGRLTAAGALLCIALACCLACVTWLWQRRRSYRVAIASFGSDLRKNLAFGKWIFFSSLLWAMSMTLYPWLLAFFHGTGATGVWGACWGVVAITNPLLLGMQNYLAPKIVQSHLHDGRAGLARFTGRATFFCALVLIPLTVFLFFFGGQLVALLYGAEYAGNDAVVNVLAVYILVTAATFPASRGLLAMERARLYFVANIVPFVVMLTCGIVVVKYFGVLGVALALLAGAVATAAIMGFLFFTVIKKNKDLPKNKTQRSGGGTHE